MFVRGFCYGGEPSGFRPETPVHTEKESRAWIAQHLAGKKITYEESGQKYRAYADGLPTGYIYFEAKVETWALLNLDKISLKGEKIFVAKGSLADMKEKCRKRLEKEHGGTLDRIHFNKTGDNIEVSYSNKGYSYGVNSDLLIVKV